MNTTMRRKMDANNDELGSRIRLQKKLAKSNRTSGDDVDFRPMVVAMESDDVITKTKRCSDIINKIIMKNVDQFYKRKVKLLQDQIDCSVEEAQRLYDVNEKAEGRKRKLERLFGLSREHTATMTRIFHETSYRVLADEEAMRGEADELRSEIETMKQQRSEAMGHLRTLKSFNADLDSEMEVYKILLRSGELRMESLQKFPIHKNVSRSRGFRHHSQLLFLSSKQSNETHEREMDWGAPRNSVRTFAIPCSDNKRPNTQSNDDVVIDCNAFQRNHVICDIITPKTMKQPSAPFSGGRFRKTIVVEQVTITIKWKPKPQRPKLQSLQEVIRNIASVAIGFEPTIKWESGKEIVAKIKRDRNGGDLLGFDRIPNKILSLTLRGLISSRCELASHVMREAIERQDRDLAMEVLWPMDNEKVARLKECYNRFYGGNLEYDVISNIDGPFQKIFLTILKENRTSDDVTVDAGQAYRDAKILFELGVKNWSPSNDQIFEIFTRRSFNQLWVMINQCWSSISNEKILALIEKECEEERKFGFRTIVRYHNLFPPSYYALQLHDAIMTHHYTRILFLCYEGMNLEEEYFRNEVTRQDPVFDQRYQLRNLSCLVEINWNFDGSIKAPNSDKIGAGCQVTRAELVLLKGAEKEAIAFLNNRLQNHLHYVDQLERKNSSLERENAKLNQEIKDSKSFHKSYGDSYDNQSSTQADQIKELQNEVYQLQQDNRNLDSTRNQLQQQLKRATMQFERGQKINENLEQKIYILVGELRHQAYDKEEMQREFDNIQGAIEQLKEKSAREYERHLMEHEDWNSQRTQMHNELSRSHAILDQLEKNKAFLDKTNRLDKFRQYDPNTTTYDPPSVDSEYHNPWQEINDEFAKLGEKAQKFEDKVTGSSPFRVYHFNPAFDAVMLRKAMEGRHDASEIVTSILTKRSQAQRNEIAEDYTEKYKEDLSDSLESKFTGHFKLVCQVLVWEKHEIDPRMVRKAVKGLGTDEAALIEILCTKDNEEIKEIKENYKTIFKGRDLQKDVEGDTSGSFKKFLVAILKANREEISGANDSDQAMDDAKTLYNLDHKQWTASNAFFLELFTQRTFHHLRRVFEYYWVELTNENILDLVDNRCKGDVKRCVRTIVLFSTSSLLSYHATQIHAALTARSVENKRLIYLIASRNEVELASIELAYEKKFGSLLSEKIKDELSGDYEAIMLALLTRAASSE